MEHRALPRTLTLPSGRRARLDGESLAREGRHGAPEPSLRRAIELLEIPGALRLDDGGAVGSLSLGDVHLLVALLCRAGLVAEPEIQVVCENCGATLSVAPSAAFEPGPFVHGEISAQDGQFDFERAYPLPYSAVTGRRARSLRLVPRTLDEARPLYTGKKLRLNAATVTALGVRSIGQVRSARALTEILARASGEVWTALGELWERAHYSPRLFSQQRCRCGARSDLVVPALRPFDMVAAPSEQLQPTERPGFPTLEEFERIAERARQRVYRRSAVRNVALTVETGVPDVDEGGQPLLGSYTPPGDDPTQHPPEIRLYYRAFQTEFRLDSGFDVAAEIHETIAHEVEHHLYFLAGDDPMDAEERLAIAQERAEIVGKQELLRRGVRDAWAELRGFVRVALPLLLLLLGLLLLQELTR